MTKAMEEARVIEREAEELLVSAIAASRNKGADAGVSIIATALAARDAEIERLREALTEIGEGRPPNPVGDPWSFYDDLVAFARRAGTAGGQHG